MGWSHSRAAGNVLTAFSDACINQTGSQNKFNANGHTYFFETSRTEYNDGAITGSIWKFLPNSDRVTRSGSFRINGNGTIHSAPKFLKDAAKTATTR